MKPQNRCSLPLYYHGGMTKAAYMQGGYHTEQCKQLQQLTDASPDSIPKHWTDEQDQWCRRNVHFLIVANEAGLQHYVKQDKLNKGFAKTGSEHAFSHINNTYGHLLSTQLCCDPRTLHCSTAKGRMHSPLFTAALLNRLTACI